MGQFGPDATTQTQARPAVRLPRYVQAWTDNQQRAWFYLRKPGTPRLRLPGLPFSPEFMQAYMAAISGTLPPTDGPGAGASRTQSGSVADAIAKYYAGPYKDLAASTREMRRGVMERLRSEHGTKRLATLTAAQLVPALSKLSPATQKHWTTALKHLLAFCTAAGIDHADPLRGWKPAKYKTDGHTPWGEDHVEAFEKRWPIGTRERLIFALLLWTAQRRGDVVRMGWQHIKQDGKLHIQQEKTDTWVHIPVHAELRKVLDKTARKQLSFLVSEHGKPINGNTLWQIMRDATKAAGLPADLTPHGLRKTCLMRLAINGASVKELQSISGHKTLAELQKYIEAVDLDKASDTAGAKMGARKAVRA